MTGLKRGVTEMTVAMAVSGTIAWFVVSSGQPVVDVVFWRCVFGAATLLVVCRATGLLRWDAMTARQVAIAMAGGVAIVANWLLLFAAYPRASITVATTVYNTQPFMLVGLGALLFRERLTLATLGWLGLAFAGMAAIVQGRPASGQAGTDYLYGVLLALGAALCYALAAMAARALKGVPPYLIVLVQVLAGTAMLAPLANLSDMPASAHAWAMLGTLGVVHTGLVFILLYGALQRLPSSVAGALSFIYPLVTIGVDVLAFGHRPHWAQAAGAAAILVAAAGITLGWSLFQQRLDAK